MAKNEPLDTHPEKTPRATPDVHYVQRSHFGRRDLRGLNSRFLPARRSMLPISFQGRTQLPSLKGSGVTLSARCPLRSFKPLEDELIPRCRCTWHCITGSQGLADFLTSEDRPLASQCLPRWQRTILGSLNALSPPPSANTARPPDAQSVQRLALVSGDVLNLVPANSVNREQSQRMRPDYQRIGRENKHSTDCPRSLGIRSVRNVGKPVAMDSDVAFNFWSEY
jgi:hypothetical protein